MKERYRSAFLIILLTAVLITASIYYIRIKENAGIREQSTWSTKQLISRDQTADIENVLYNKDGISAQYPKLVQGGSEVELKAWNQIIQEDFNKILKIYSFNPFPEPTPVEAGRIPTILKIQYTIKANNEKFISILYSAAYNSLYSAHPTELIYTTNISKKDGRRLKLSDIVNLNEDFVKNFKAWNFTSTEQSNAELNQAVKDYVANISDSDLLTGFQAADIIGSGNLWGIYSYLTDDRLGISLGVPNYAGDHAEFEKEYVELNKFLKTDKK